MTILLKLAETSKNLSSIFDFRLSSSRSLYSSIFMIIIRVILLIPVGMFLIFLQIFLYSLYLMMFFTSVPGALVKKTRMESLGYDDKNKWLFNISYFMLYFFVLMFELAYIVINFWIVILSFIMDCLIWILTLGKTKLGNTEISLNDESNISQLGGNSDVLMICLTLVSPLLFFVFSELFIPRDIDIYWWLIISILVLGLNTLVYMLFYHKNILQNKD